MKNNNKQTVKDNKSSSKTCNDREKPIHSEQDAGLGVPDLDKKKYIND